MILIKNQDIANSNRQSAASTDPAPDLDSSSNQTTGVSQSLTRVHSSTSQTDSPANSFDIIGDITGQSTGTGSYDDFVSVFRDRYERLSSHLRGRVNHRPTQAVASMSGNAETAIVGLVNDIRSTKMVIGLSNLKIQQGRSLVL